MSGYAYHDDYYTAMVTAASNYPDMPNQRMPPSSAAGAGPHGCSNTYSSANSSTSTGSNNPGCARYPSYRAGCQRLPTNANPCTTSGAPNTSLQSANTSAPVVTTTKTYKHNPYAALVAVPSSKDTSFNTSLDSYQSFQATYAECPNNNYPNYQPQQTYTNSSSHPSQGPQPPQPQQQQRRVQKISMPTARNNANGGSYPPMSQPPPRQPVSGGQQPVYGPTNGDPRVMTSNMTEQFVAAIGNLAPTACSARGRQLLISILRMQHVDKIELIYDELVPGLNTIALDPQGCHVLRTLIEFITTRQMEAMVPAFHAKTVLDMATATQNTRRTLQAVFERHQTPALTPIVEVIASDSQRLAGTQQGCIAIMRVLEHGLPEQRHILVASLLPVLPALTMDPYGNYVVQCILDNATDGGTIEDVCAAFAQYWVPLSCNKFASNVMEKVVRQMPTQTRAALVAELVFQAENLHRLMQDAFGNFVLQAIIASSTDPVEFDQIYSLVEELVHSSPYGHKIDAKLRGKHMNIYGKEAPRIKPPKDPKT